MLGRPCRYLRRSGEGDGDGIGMGTGAGAGTGTGTWDGDGGWKGGGGAGGVRWDREGKRGVGRGEERRGGEGRDPTPRILTPDRGLVP